MSLIPDTLEEFRSKEFWDGFFRARGNQPFEWYCGFTALESVFEEQLKGKRVLIPGCGNSDLSSEMYDAGYEQITNLDFSSLVIREMLTRNLRKRPNMRWIVMDITQMKLAVASFDLVLDKGALDALLGDSESTESAIQYLKEVVRVLALDGAFYCVSLLQSHVISAFRLMVYQLIKGVLLHDFKIEVSAIDVDLESQVSEVCPFIIKAKRLIDYDMEYIPPIILQPSIWNLPNQTPQIQDILRIATEENDRRKNEKGSIRFADFIDLHPGRRVVIGQMECFKSKKQKIRFQATVIDNNESFPQCCAVYIIPKGKELTWLYGSAEGQWTVSKQCQSSRVILVSVNWSTTTPSLEKIKEAISGTLSVLIPESVRHLPKAIPILTSQEPDIPYSQRAMYQSEISGIIIIKDCIENHVLLRRMIFGEGQSLIQTETKLLLQGGHQVSELKDVPSDLQNITVCLTSLSAQYHQFIVSALILTESLKGCTMKVLVVGLGGGILPMFLSNHMNLDLRVVEIDPMVLEVAEKWFSFDTGISVIIDDGIRYIQELEDSSLDILIIDAGGSESSSRMSCPPKDFISTSFYSTACRALTEDGMMIINFVTRSNDALMDALEVLRLHLPFIYSLKAEEDLNQVIIARKTAFPEKEDFFRLKAMSFEPDWDLLTILTSIAIVK